MLFFIHECNRSCIDSRPDIRGSLGGLWSINRLAALKYKDHVTGDIDVTGSGQIILGDGVQATIYFDRNLRIAGNGILNPSNQPSDLLLYGVQPAADQNFVATLGGNGTITAALYAPGHAVTVDGGGTDGHVFGSVVGKTVNMNGVTNLHYDEALSEGGLINNYQIVSWFEDTR